MFLLVHCSLTAQQWSDPIVVSSTIGFNMDSDFVIDNENNIHVVWNYKVEDNFWKVFYSVSYDGGNSWSEAVDLLENNSQWMSQPHIASDSENNLYVTYDHDTGNPSQMMVYMIKNLDGVWISPEIVSTDMFGSSYNQIIIDADDRLYIFWKNNSRSFYKYYEDSCWSEIQSPYEPNNLITSLSLDSQNNLHCCGGNWTSSPDKIKLSYYYYDKAGDLWASPEILTSSFIEVDQDIGVDNFGNPHLTWRERDQIPIPENDFTLYQFYNGMNWTEKEIVVEDPWEQQIAIDQNNGAHIVDREKLPVGWQLVHHRKIEDQWVSCLVDSSEVVVARPEIICCNDKLYLTYDKTWDSGVNGFISDIFISSFDIQTGLEPSYINLPIDLSIYPNPSNDVINIDFLVNEDCFVNLYIFSLNGGLVVQLENSNLSSGNYHYQWDGCNNDGSKLKSGLYLCRLQQGKTIITRSIQITN